VDPVGHGRDEGGQKGRGGDTVRLVDQLDEGELAGAVDGDEEVELAFRGLYLGGVDVEEPDWIGFEGLLCRLVALDVGQSSDAVARQGEGELSLPDQIRQGQEYCTVRGLDLVETYSEPGASATDDRRPEFKRLIDAATSAARPFDIVLVHSMSRFFREQFLSEMYIRKLRKVGVELISITQDFRDDSTGSLIRQILGSFDEYQSRENGKHTLRATQENARQGFWNGSVPPFGYRARAAEKRGTKTKKVLAVDDAEAAIVRRIYDLALGRAGMPIGIKAIVNELNASCVQCRGKPFHISAVHRILTTSTYAGTHYFDRREARTGRAKAAAQWVVVAVPPLVSIEEFEQVQASLHARSPRRVPPRVVGNPTLLTGLARCATCGSGMTLRTGKSDRYRYYTCAGAAQKGKTLCPGRSISMPDLDGAVLGHLVERLLTPDRLQIILEAYVARSAGAEAARGIGTRPAGSHRGRGAGEPTARTGRTRVDEPVRPRAARASADRQAGPGSGCRASASARGTKFDRHRAVHLGKHRPFGQRPADRLKQR
jgi:DNA invertase Pin-like site-specific DNA recombinase